MKELPILFNGAMVRAILEGRKTQTRRAVKPQPEYRENESLPGHYGTWFHGWNLDHKHLIPSDYWKHCPYGQPGDHLWVRETTEEDCAGSVSFARYSVDKLPVLSPSAEYCEWWYSRPTCPSIHMPRWASRITLEITGVRVERLRDITKQDVSAEGLPIDGLLEEQAIHSFKGLWEAINGAGSWDANPWVWVVEFRRVIQ